MNGFLGFWVLSMSLLPSLPLSFPLLPSPSLSSPLLPSPFLSSPLLPSPSLSFPLLPSLPSPSLSFPLLPSLPPESNSVTESLEMLKVALGRLPLAHYNTLRHLIRHLHRSATQLTTNPSHRATRDDSCGMRTGNKASMWLS